MGISSEDRSQELKHTGPFPKESRHTPQAPSPDGSTLGDIEFTKQFRKIWCNVTDDSYHSLFGFRRFRTAHLLNLRFLEDEIDKIDHEIFQAGFKLGLSHTVIDRLGLKHGKRDVVAQAGEGAVNRDLILRLRELIKQYGMCHPR